MTDDTINAAIAACEAQARRHYENFPTASRLLARPQRQATAVIYSFARTADDIVDEGELSKTERHRLLDTFTARLQDIQNGAPVSDGLFRALADTIRTFELPIEPFVKLLSAFRDDIDVHCYADEAQLLNYCARSANPVGELVLRLHGHYSEQNLAWSDQICTALQLINFIQDLDSDVQLRKRLYIPLQELADAGVTQDDLRQRRNTPALRRLLAEQITRTETRLLAGVPLLQQVDWRLRQVLKLTLLGGLRMISKLHRRTNPYVRPVLGRGDRLVVLGQAFCSSKLSAHANIRK